MRFDSIVKPRRTSYKADERLGDWHRHALPPSCPAVDIDYLATCLVEYNYDTVAAIIEYKHEQVRELDFDSYNFRAVQHIADRAGLPFFCVVYADDFAWFQVHPVNRVAFRLQNEVTTMHQEDFIHFHERIRGLA